MSRDVVEEHFQTTSVRYDQQRDTTQGVMSLLREFDCDFQRVGHFGS